MNAQKANIIGVLRQRFNKIYNESIGIAEHLIRKDIEKKNLKLRWFDEKNKSELRP